MIKTYERHAHGNKSTLKWVKLRPKWLIVPKIKLAGKLLYVLAKLID